MYLYIKTFGNNNNNKKNQLLDKIHYYFHPTHEAEQRGRGAGRGRGGGDTDGEHSHKYERVRTGMAKVSILSNTITINKHIKEKIQMNSLSRN